MQTVTAAEVPEGCALRGMLAAAHFSRRLSHATRQRQPHAAGDLPALPQDNPRLGGEGAGAAQRNRAPDLASRTLGRCTPLTDQARRVDYRVGDRLGIFTIFGSTPDELLLGIDDSHLDLRVSVLKQGGARPSYIISTVVKVHNWLGRAYMLPVGRIHPLIVKTMMRRAAV